MGGSVRYAVPMGKNLGLVVIAALLLTGCANGGSGVGSAPTVTVTATPTSAATAAPVTVQGEAETAEEPVDDPKAAFLSDVKDKWDGDIPSDQELLNAGAYACDQYDTGLMHTDIVAVQGEGAGENNSRLVIWAGHYLCPKYNTLVK